MGNDDNRAFSSVALPRLVRGARLDRGADVGARRRPRRTTPERRDAGARGALRGEHPACAYGRQAAVVPGSGDEAVADAPGRALPVRGSAAGRERPRAFARRARRGAALLAEAIVPVGDPVTPADRLQRVVAEGGAPCAEPCQVGARRPGAQLDRKAVAVRPARLAGSTVERRGVRGIGRRHDDVGLPAARGRRDGPDEDEQAKAAPELRRSPAHAEGPLSATQTPTVTAGRADQSARPVVRRVPSSSLK